NGTVLAPSSLPPLRQPEPEPAARAGHWTDVESFIRAQLDPSANDLYAQAHREVDRLLLPLALQKTGGNQRDAAQLLGISRQTFRVKLRQLGLQVGYHVKPMDSE
ncbi:MAG TPA: helix-turn-helix domain-containing protein, partial [Kofleriaceae bacterium]